jgi:hypothetical protein
MNQNARRNSEKYKAGCFCEVNTTGCAFLYQFLKSLLAPKQNWVCACANQ